MNTKVRKRFLGLANRILILNQDAPKYTVDHPRKDSTQTSKGSQLTSYLRYSVRMERKF